MCLGDINFVYMFQYVAVIGWLVAGSLYVMLTYLPGLVGCLQGIGVPVDCPNWTQASYVVWTTLYRPLWGVWVCWLICACHAGWGGQFINELPCKLPRISNI